MTELDFRILDFIREHFSSGPMDCLLYTSVLATPAMMALMEYTASQSVASELEDGQSTVGTLVDVKHVAATPVGMQVTCISELTEIDRRRLVFRVTASDACGLIGEGIHERFIIDKEKFLAKTNARKE